jgi:hypothetical protein
MGSNEATKKASVIPGHLGESKTAPGIHEQVDAFNRGQTPC